MELLSLSQATGHSFEAERTVWKQRDCLGETGFNPPSSDGVVRMLPGRCRRPLTYAAVRAPSPAPACFTPCAADSRLAPAEVLPDMLTNPAR